MQKAAQYRQFAETLTLAAEDASAPTREMMLELAQAWTTLAEQADAEAIGATNIVDFAVAKLQRRDPRAA
jgi:hypothetical protein